MNKAAAALDQAFASTATKYGSSRWKEYWRCPHAHYLRYDKGVQLQEPPDYFEIGSLVHATLAYTALGVIDGFNARPADVIKEAKARKKHQMEHIHEAERIMAHYFRYYGLKNAGYPRSMDILEVEHFVSAPASKLGLKYTGRLDLLGEVSYQKRDRLVIYDHKTRKYVPKPETNDDATLGDYFRTNPQFMGLIYCTREVEGEIPLFCVNMIGKAKMPAFRRVIFDTTDEQLEEWAENHRIQVRNGTVDTHKNYNECVPWIGNPCWAFQWCHKPELREKLYKIKKPKKKLDLGPAYAPFVRGSATSEAAAASTNAEIDELRVYKAIAAAGGLTDDEGESVLGLPHQTYSARRRGLALKSKVFDTGERRLTRHNRKAIVWAVKE